MNKTIRTYDDLCDERRRMKDLLIVQKQRVKDDWDSLKHEFDPVKNAFGVIGKMANPDKKNPLLNVGLKMATDLVIGKFILGKAGWITRLAVPFVVKNYSSHVLSDKGKGVIGKLANLFKSKPKETQSPFS